MDFHNYITAREACKRSGAIEDPDEFYRAAFAEALRMRSGQFFGQIACERDWERAHRPYYNVWPSIVPMLTRLNLDLDSALIQLPLPALCIRLPKEENPLSFPWEGKETPIRCMLLGEINQGRGLSILIDVGEVMGDGKDFGVPIYTYRNFRREAGLTVEGALRELGMMVSGDDKCCAEARSWLPGVVTCQTKVGTGPQSADVLPLRESRSLITQKTKEALAKREEIRPIKIEYPATIRWDYYQKGLYELTIQSSSRLTIHDELKRPAILLKHCYSTDSHTLSPSGVQGTDYVLRISRHLLEMP